MSFSNKKQQSKNKAENRDSVKISGNANTYNSDHQDLSKRKTNLQLLFIAAVLSLLVLFTYWEPLITSL